MKLQMAIKQTSNILDLSSSAKQNDNLPIFLTFLNFSYYVGFSPIKLKVSDDGYVHMHKNKLQSVSKSLKT